MKGNYRALTNLIFSAHWNSHKLLYLYSYLNMPKNNQSAISKNWSKLSRPGIMSHTSLCKINPKPFRYVMSPFLLNKKICLFSSSVTSIQVLENTVSGPDISSRFPNWKHLVWDIIFLQNCKADFYEMID